MSNGCALVTGGGRRIGRAIALELAGAGYDVAVTYHRGADAAAEVKAAIEAQSRRCIAIQADLTAPEQAVATIGQEVQTEFGRLDVLINNASIYAPSSFDAPDVGLMKRMYSIHVEAPLLLARQFAGMLRESRGHIINMTDLLAERPWPAYMAYCASKAALSNLTLSLARELAPGVSVNAIAPGVVEWPDDFSQSEREKYLRRVPLARAGTPEDVASLVHFLITGGKYMTGQILRLDGGRSIT